MPTKHGPLTINDPLYGFVQVPRGLLTELIDHPWFQRLGRIRQLGMSAFVYPGAQHTRLAHSIGALHLMQQALRTLESKGTFLFETEREAVCAAILLHDLGHGPFSHVLEGTLLPVSHEAITLSMIEELNTQFDGRLTLALKILKGETAKPFLHELISSQLDMDRMDYLVRDSFYTGVREGSIGAARIIGQLVVDNDRLAVSHKGLYSVENYLISRRAMYWQVYLHKTTVAAEEVLRSALRRARHLVGQGHDLFASPALQALLRATKASDVAPALFARVDDSDVLCALKQWQHADDVILARLSAGFLNRNLFKVDVCEEAPTAEAVDAYRQRVQTMLSIPYEDTDYFVRPISVEKAMYNPREEGIRIQQTDGTVSDVSQLSRLVAGEATARPDSKFYLCHLRDNKH
ncbi:MAG: HD domain-containing protein [Alloprevotella sp.]|nr:HD domain-containing protein [Alloprevotella sp.]